MNLAYYIETIISVSFNLELFKMETIKDIISEHRQDFSELRRLCLVCHGLDLTTSSLSLDSSRLNVTESVETALQNLLSSNLLNLAIAIRVNLYQKKIAKSNIELPDSAWLFYGKDLTVKPATLKQVCDKIIHADSVGKSIFPNGMWKGESKIAIQFKGVEFGKKNWTLDIVLERFAEDVLNLLNDIEAK